MDRDEPPASKLPRLHTPDEIADALGVSGWWVREQCRKRRIPFARVGGAYRFTSDHLAEIVSIFEERPGRSHGSSTATRSTRRRVQPQSTPPAVPLRARPPRRVRSGGGGDDAA